MTYRSADTGTGSLRTSRHTFAYCRSRRSDGITDRGRYLRYALTDGGCSVGRRFLGGLGGSSRCLIHGHAEALQRENSSGTYQRSAHYDRTRRDAESATSHRHSDPASAGSQRCRCAAHRATYCCGGRCCSHGISRVAVGLGFHVGIGSGL